MNIIIAGASGFIGSELMKDLPDAIGISRGTPKNSRWIFADLFSRSLCEKALKNCDIAIYLVHSMLPTSHLDQGDFQDFDLIIADNFARACRLNGVKQIIYLGGLIPNEPKEILSPHLKSRKEVEDILKTSNVPVTTLRAGLIIGDKGSSFNILRNIALRAPVLIYPKWLMSNVEPVGIRQVVDSIKYCINNKETFNNTYDLGMGEIITYKDLIVMTRKNLGKKTLEIPFFVPKTLVKYCVSFLSKAPTNLVRPLVSSLKHNMVTDNNKKLIIPNYPLPSLENLLNQSLSRREKTPQAFKQRPNNRVVRSIQRINVSCSPKVQVYKLYFPWLTQFKILSLFLKVDISNDTCVFKFLGVPLLILKHLKENSEENRELLSITGGILVSKQQLYGRLEFRKFPQCLIVAIHDYMPSLSWYIYVYSQALVHKVVMTRFSKYLEKTDICSKP